MKSILDVETLEQVVWSAQVVRGALAWTRTFTWKAEGRRVETSTDDQLGAPAADVR